MGTGSPDVDIVSEEWKRNRKMVDEVSSFSSLSPLLFTSSPADVIHVLGQ